MTAGLAIQATTGLRSLPVSPWAGLGVLAAWAATALLAGSLLLHLPGQCDGRRFGPRRTGPAKLRPASAEQTATTWPVMSPGESCWVVQSQTAHTRPSGPAAS
jgi:hypothetical protein